MKKKKSEMTPYERVDKSMEGMSWDEAEEVGIEILARVMALHVYSRKEEDYIGKLMKRICVRADEWAHESERNIFTLAMAAVGFNISKGHVECDVKSIKDITNKQTEK